MAQLVAVEEETTAVDATEMKLVIDVCFRLFVDFARTTERGTSSSFAPISSESESSVSKLAILDLKNKIQSVLTLNQEICKDD